jgi:osmotically-inducible protein OsmY
MKIAHLLAFFALAALAAGCANNHPSDYAYGYPHTVYYTDSRAARRAAEAQWRADQDLVASVRGQFDQYGYLNEASQNVDVTARNGTVTLSGSVPTQKDRDMIDAMVRNTHGVAAVNNLLEVSALSPTARADGMTVYRNRGENFNLHVQGLNETDRRLAQDILRQLRNDPALSASTSPVDIYVENGFVTLQGGVASEAERQMIIAAVQRAAGPNVSSDLRVRPLVR